MVRNVSAKRPHALNGVGHGGVGHGDGGGGGRRGQERDFSKPRESGL